MAYVLWTLIGYLSGSILYGYLVPLLLKGIDVRKVSPDGNPGTYNAMVYAGKPIGALVAFLELMKGFIPVHLAANVLDTTNILFALVVVAPCLGHGFSMFAHFHGGKCLGVSYGVLLGLAPHDWVPILALCIIYQLLSKIFVITPHFCRSLTIYTLVAIVSLIMGSTIGIKIGTLLVCLVVISKHLNPMNGLKYTVRFCPKLRS